MGFVKAVKSQSKLRLALFAPAGAGKTYTSLELATGLVGEKGKIGVIDTERFSASKYADRFEFDILDLERHTIADYIDAINQASDYDVLIIDSLSHAWAELLIEIDRLAKAKYRGNTWSAWSEGTPQQRALVNAILGFNGHLIATMRVKTEWSTEKTDNGKSRPVKVGLAPEQGKGIEYEFDMLMEINTEHFATITKDRSGKFQDKIIEKPNRDLGEKLKSWLETGEKIEAKITNSQITKIFELSDENAELCKTILSKFGYSTSKDVKQSDYEKICKAIENKLKKAS